MTQVNLLPLEVQQRRRTRRHTTMVTSAVAGVVGFLILIFILQSARLAAANRQLEEQTAANGRLQTEINGLTRFEQLKQAVTEKEGLLASVLRGEILWSGVLRDISLVIPRDMWLTSLTGQMQVSSTSSSVSAPAGAPAGEGLVGTIQFQGQAFAHTTVADWLTRLESVEGWLNPWISTSSRAGQGTQVSFSSSVDLSVAATRDGGQ
ncbi:MAG: PilN domain-containing protein [Actinomycetota bacterium]|nr:PilN domain-containing protein [Actinomycetota bacterium]